MESALTSPLTPGPTAITVASVILPTLDSGSKIPPFVAWNEKLIITYQFGAATQRGYTQGGFIK